MQKKAEREEWSVDRLGQAWFLQVIGGGCGVKVNNWARKVRRKEEERRNAKEMARRSHGHGLKHTYVVRECGDWQLWDGDVGLNFSRSHQQRPGSAP